MKKSKIPASILTIFVLAGFLAANVFAANKYIGVEWWNQPDPNAGETFWSEPADGSFEQIDMTSAGLTTIAYVPAGYAAGATAAGMPRNFDFTIDLMIPDQEEFPDSWAGFYLRASQPQTGAGGYVFHMNSDGLAILDGESQTSLIEERVNPELFDVTGWNRIRVVLNEKDLTVWINGTEAYTYGNCMTGPGYLGLSTVNYLGKFRNLKLIADGDKEFSAFTVAGTDGPLSTDGSSSAAASSEAASEQASSEAESVASAVSETSAASTVSTASAADEPSGNSTAMIIIIIALVVVAGAVAGFIIAKKKRS